MISAAILLAAAAATPPTPFDEIVAAERAFAGDSPVKGLHGAFLAHLADDSLLFRPTPQPGRAAHEGRPPATGLLSWGPAWAAVAGSGDWGLTSGPSEYREPGKDAPEFTGWFFSVWTKKSGAWKVRADIGISCPLTYAPPAEVSRGPEGASGIKAETSRRRFAAEDGRLNREAKLGIGAALASRVDDATRVYRDGSCPQTGNDARRLALADTRKLDCRPEGIEVAPSGELGFVYGTCTAVGGPADAKTGYLRVWRVRPDRHVAPLVDVVLPLPESK